MPIRALALHLAVATGSTLVLLAPAVVAAQSQDRAPLSGSIRGPGGDPAAATAPGLADNGPDTSILGAGSAAAVRSPSQRPPPVGPGSTAVDVARSFLWADRNGDGELSRAEAQRLGLNLEAMDTDFDGVVDRGEYEDGLR